MTEAAHLILINGQDKTDSIADLYYHDNWCDVTYANAPKVYRYKREKVQELELIRLVDPTDQIVVAQGIPLSQVEVIQDFGPVYRILCREKRPRTYRKWEVEFQRNCLAERQMQDTFGYFKATAEAVSLVMENKRNILSAQYKQIQAVSDKTVLACYLDKTKQPGDTVKVTVTVIQL